MSISDVFGDIKYQTFDIEEELESFRNKKTKLGYTKKMYAGQRIHYEF